MEITRERRAGPKRIGELLVAANVIKPEVLLEALRIAKKSSTPLGRVLMSIGELTERDLATTIEIQSLLREGVISSDFGVRALNVAIKSCLSVEDAFSRLGWKAPQREIIPGSELGELLVEAGIVSHQVLNEAVAASKENNLPLGRCLVLARAVPSSLLSSALTAQVLLRDGKISRDQATAGLRAAARKHQPLEASLQESGAYRPAQAGIRVGDLLTSAGLVSESDKISAIEIGLVNQQPVGQVLVQAGMITQGILEDSLKLQTMVSNGNLTGIQAAEILRQSKARNISIEDVLSERSTKEDEIARANSVVEMLLSLGLIPQDQMMKAEGVSRQLHVSTGEVLLSTGVIDRKLVQSALAAQSMLIDGVMRPEHARAVLNYCQKTGLDFADAVKEVSWTPTSVPMDRDAQSNSWFGKIWNKVKKPE